MDKQRSTKHTHKTKDRTSQKTGDELECSWYTCDNRRVTLTIPVMSHE